MNDNVKDSNTSSGPRNFEKGGPRNMTCMAPCAEAIFFQIIFYRPGVGVGTGLTF